MLYQIKKLLLVLSLSAISTYSLSSTYVPDDDNGGTLYPFNIEGVGEIQGHDGYALHYWNEFNLAAKKKVILHLSDYDYEDPARQLQKNLGFLDESWNDSYGNIYKARKAKLIYDGHLTTAPTIELNLLPAIVFVPRDSSLGIKDNSENVTAALNHVNEMAKAAGITDDDGDGFPDYELIVVAHGISGLWARASFAQEQSNFGVDKFITLDTPHKGIITSFGIAGHLSYLSVGSDLVPQIQEGRNDYNFLFSWLEGEETEAFISTTIDPMDTIAVAYSNGEASWDLGFAEWWGHTIYHGVASIVELSQIETLLQQYNRAVDDFLTSILGPDHGFSLTLGEVANGTTSLVPYHSAIMADMPYSTDGLDGWTTMTTTGFLEYEVNYITTDSQYFDTKVSFLKTDGSPNDSFYLTLDPVGIAEKHAFLWPLISL